jgi:hypothetical protein
VPGDGLQEHSGIDEADVVARVLAEARADVLGVLEALFAERRQIG